MLLFVFQQTMKSIAYCTQHQPCRRWTCKPCAKFMSMFCVFIDKRHGGHECGSLLYWSGVSKTGGPPHLICVFKHKIIPNETKGFKWPTAQAPSSSLWLSKDDVKNIVLDPTLEAVTPTVDDPVSCPVCHFKGTLSHITTLNVSQPQLHAVQQQQADRINHSDGTVVKVNTTFRFRRPPPPSPPPPPPPLLPSYDEIKRTSSPHPLHHRLLVSPTSIAPRFPSASPPPLAAGDAVKMNNDETDYVERTLSHLALQMRRPLPSQSPPSSSSSSSSSSSRWVADLPVMSKSIKTMKVTHRYIVDVAYVMDDPVPKEASYDSRWRMDGNPFSDIPARIHYKLHPHATRSGGGFSWCGYYGDPATTVTNKKDPAYHHRVITGPVAVRFFPSRHTTTQKRLCVRCSHVW